MKKINIILIFLLSILWIPNTFAQARIEVTVQHAANGTTSGALTIEVFNTDGAYSYYVLTSDGEDVISAVDAPENSKTFIGIAPDKTFN